MSISIIKKTNNGNPGEYRYQSSKKPSDDWLLHSDVFFACSNSVPGVINLQSLLIELCEKYHFSPLQVPASAEIITINHENWIKQMSDLGIIQDSTLQHVCLPGTHDSATANLRDELADSAAEDLKKLLDDTLPMIRDIIKTAAVFSGFLLGLFLFYFWLIQNRITAAIYTSINNLAKATTTSIDKQLKDGIRSLDLRLYYNKRENKFYSLHSLIGEEYHGILDKIVNFLDTHPGEIVYLWFRIYSHTEHDKAVWDDDSVITKFGDLLYEKLKDYAINRLELPTGKDPFTMKYNMFVNDKNKKARVIIQFSKLGNNDPIEVKGNGNLICFQPSEWNLINKSSSDYAEKPDVPKNSTMTKDQVVKYQRKWYEEESVFAQNNNRPFMTWFTRPPSAADSTNIGYCEAKKALLDKLPPGISNLANKAWAVTDPQYRSLLDLAKPLNAGLAESLDTIIPIKREEPEKCVLSGIYVDFYESTDVVDLAITRSAIQFDFAHK